MAPRVLVVDDSAYVRKAVAVALEADGIEVVGFARDGEEAIERNVELAPDVVVLDLQMPRVDGVAALRGMTATRPVPTLVFADVTSLGAELAVAALAEGALDVVAKPSAGEPAHDLALRVWAVATARAPRAPPKARGPHAPPRAVAIAASTGGPPLVERLLAALPEGYPAPVLVAQHMPAPFTGQFAARLDSIARVRVFEGGDGSEVGPGDACILPGGLVSTVSAARGSALALRTVATSPLGGARPNASALFFSALAATQGDVCAVVLSGMGADGSDAIPALLGTGAEVLAQDPEEAVLPSMPNAAIAAGARVIGGVDEIARRLVSLAGRQVEGRS